MKQVVTLIDTDSKTVTKVFNTRNEALFRATLNTRSAIFKLKKGKGSFTRNKKYLENF